MVIPAARKLYESGSQIDWLCGKSVTSLLSCYSWINPIPVEDSRLFGGDRLKAMGEMIRVWRKLAGSSYDLCAVLVYDRRYRLLTLPIRAKRKVAMDWNNREFKLVSIRHHTAEYARILLNLKDEFRTENLSPVSPDNLPPNPLPKRGGTRVSLVPGGARNLLRDDPQRRWPLDSYVELTKLLLERGYEVVLTGGPGDSWIRPSFAGLPVADGIGSWSIAQVLSFYDSCDCVVTHDTGPMHLAGLTQCGLVGLFGPTAPSNFLPRRDSVLGLWGGEKLPCRPCHDGRAYANCSSNGCMQSISPQKVYEAVESVLLNRGQCWRVESF